MSQRLRVSGALLRWGLLLTMGLGIVGSAAGLSLGQDVRVQPDNRVQLDDVAEASGIHFQHFSPLTPERHLHLFMGSGLGWIDYDRDGWPDLYLGQGQAWNTNGETGETNERKEQGDAHSNQLYRNLGDGHFGDVTSAAGLTDFHYSMGVAVGDYNNDGFPDLYVSNFGSNLLYRNNGDGTFAEQAAQLGMDDGRFGSSCTWADVDSDGNLDLYVVNYLHIDRNNYPLCKFKVLDKVYAAGCHPRYLPADFDVLYHNEGDGRFTDVSERAGLRSGAARQGLGIVAADFDGDGRVDFYVANDSVDNQLWLNRGDGTFFDNALLMGVAVNRSGQREAGMGVAVGDVDGDGRFDLFVTNYFSETNTLYRNDGPTFTDVTLESGLGAPSKLRLGFGASLFDADNDGWLDLFVANGHVHTHLQGIGRNEPFAQLPQLFRNDHGRRFQDVSDKAGPFFRTKAVGRASAVADFDRDGRADLAVSHLNGPATLLRNQSEPVGHWVPIELIGTAGNRDAIGAVVELSVGQRRLVRARIGSSSYLSCDDGELLVGIGESRAVDRLSVRWPSGRREHWLGIPANAPVRLIEGTGLVD